MWKVGKARESSPSETHLLQGRLDQLLHLQDLASLHDPHLSLRYVPQKATVVGVALKITPLHQVLHSIFDVLCNGLENSNLQGVGYSGSGVGEVAVRRWGVQSGGGGEDEEANQTTHVLQGLFDQCLYL